MGVYGNGNTGHDEPGSWIPKRFGESNTFIDKAKRIAPESQSLSEVRASEILDEESETNICAEMFFASVEAYLLTEFGENGFEVRWSHFLESWEKMSEKYGEDLLFALVQMDGDISDTGIINFAGYINKEVLKAQISLVRSRNQRSVRS